MVGATCTGLTLGIGAVGCAMIGGMAGGAIGAWAINYLDAEDQTINEYAQDMMGSAAISAIPIPGGGAAKGLAKAAAEEAATKTSIGFAKGLGETALTPGRLQHGTKNLTKAGVLPPWSGKNSPGVIKRAFVPILEHPSVTVDHTLGGTRVKGFLGDIDGQQVAVFVYKEGPYQGQLASSSIPSPNPAQDVGDPVTPSLARDSLTIFVDGDEVPGLIVYGLALRDTWRSVGFPAEVWLAVPEVEEFRLHGDSWQVVMWEVPIIVWPSAREFAAAVRHTLGAMIDGGCRVAWIGAEGVPFCDPPQLFDHDCMSGGVLAWMTDDGGFECPIDPDRPLVPVSDHRLHALRVHAQGLADAL
jgi:hypothetical protein